MQTSTHLFLCGFMGTGKSTLGRYLARLLNMDFWDLDRVIETQTGYSIAEIFESEGEDGFRQRERQVLEEMFKRPSAVVALGGGTLQNQQMIDEIRKNGLLVFIETPISTILGRIMRNRQRPLLLDEKGNLKKRSVLESEVKERYRSRLPHYRQAHLTFKPDEHDNPEAAAKKLAQSIREYVSTY